MPIKTVDRVPQGTLLGVTPTDIHQAINTLNQVVSLVRTLGAVCRNPQWGSPNI